MKLLYLILFAVLIKILFKKTEGFKDSKCIKTIEPSQIMNNNYKNAAYQIVDDLRVNNRANSYLSDPFMDTNTILDKENCEINYITVVESASTNPVQEVAPVEFTPPT